MRRGVRAAAIVAVSALVVGCTGEADDPPTEATDAAGAEVGADPDGDPTAEDADEAGSDDEVEAGDPVDAGPPLVSVEHQVAEGGTAEIDVRAAEAGELFRVTLTITARGTGDTTVAELFGGVGGAAGISGRLIDAANLLEYELVFPTVPHGSAVRIAEDQPVTLHFYFGAPVAPFESFDFLLDLGASSPNWPGVVDVPFSAG